MTAETPFITTIERPGGNVDNRREILDMVAGRPIQTAAYITRCDIPLQISPRENTTYIYATGKNDVHYQTKFGEEVMKAGGLSVVCIPPQKTISHLSLPEESQLLVLQSTDAEPVQQQEVHIQRMDQVTILPPQEVTLQTEGFQSTNTPLIYMQGERVTFTMAGIIHINESQDGKPLVVGKHAHPRSELFIVRGDYPVVLEEATMETIEKSNYRDEIIVSQCHVLAPGSIVVIPPGVFHSFYNPEGKAFTLIPLTTEFNPQQPDFVAWKGFTPDGYASDLYMKQAIS